MEPLTPLYSDSRRILESLPERRRILVLGSTGSIGQSALDIIERFPEKFELTGLVAFGSKPEIYADQIRKFSPSTAIIIDASHKNHIETLSGQKILCGIEHVLEACSSSEVDIVLAAIVGAAGLAPVIASLEAGKVVALANKESLVVGGSLVRDLCAQKGALILPVDSEHSALFKCLMGIKMEEVASLILTASGGPFLRKSLGELQAVTPAEAIKHPRWQMGPKISVDSATLVNKALELIEAHYLYAVCPDRLSAIIHPQSLVHAIVNVKDGTSIFQAAVPDMREPIAFALDYPRPRIQTLVSELDLGRIGNFQFEDIDHQRFPIIKLALDCMEQGSLSCLLLNEANEYAVAAFLAGRLRFVDIVPFIEDMLAQDISVSINSLLDIYAIQAEIKRLCDFVVMKFKLG